MSDRPSRVVRTSTPSTPVQGDPPQVSFTHPYRLFLVLVLYLCLLGSCGWYVTRWASYPYPPDAQPYTRPLRTRPPLH